MFRNRIALKTKARSLIITFRRSIVSCLPTATATATVASKTITITISTRLMMKLLHPRKRNSKSDGGLERLGTTGTYCTTVRQ
tara:strand:+ start:29 stop:277 length:249 start_codon:yes stop_codon:yes gene_type:complete